MADIHPLPTSHGAFAVRIHGRCWLRVTPNHPLDGTMPLGWRALTWTRGLAEAEKWARREAASRFADKDGFEVVDLEARAASPA